MIYIRIDRLDCYQKCVRVRIGMEDGLQILNSGMMNAQPTLPAKLQVEILV